MQADLERAAAILVDLKCMSERQVMAKWKVAPRTIRNYKTRVKTDKQLAALFAEKAKVVMYQDWALGLSRALSAHIEKHRQIAEGFDSSNITSDSFNALTESTRVLGELAMGLEVLRGAADGEQNRGLEA